MTLWQHRPKHIAEYLAIRTFSVFFQIIPQRAALAIAWFCALLAHHVFRWRTAEARRRIREVFGTTITEARVRTIAWLAMRNLMFNAVDSFRIPQLTPEIIRATTDGFDITDTFRHHLRDGRGLIVCIPHAGGWERAAIGLSLHGIPVATIIARMKNPLADRFLTTIRTRTGVEATHRDDNVVRTVTRLIKSGKLLAILPDLRSKTPGTRVHFLGKEANLVSGLGLFARLSRAPVIPAFVTREGWTRHRWRIFPPIWSDPALDRDTDTQRIMDYVMTTFDTAIRAEPEQFFWYNKRWVLEPLHENPPPEKNPEPGNT